MESEKQGANTEQSTDGGFSTIIFRIFDYRMQNFIVTQWIFSKLVKEWNFPFFTFCCYFFFQHFLSFYSIKT